MAITGAQIRMARALMKWSIEDLATRAGVGLSTVQRLEMVDGLTTSTRIGTLQAIHDAFIATGKVRFEGETCVCIDEGDNKK